MADIKLGIYEHYTGRRYKVLGVAKHEETLEDLVVYQTLYENPVSTLWVRPFAQFVEEVERGTYRGPRFRFISK